MVWLALRSALSDRAAGGMAAVVDAWGFTAPKTKEAVAALRALGVEPRERGLVVLGRDDEIAWRAFRNLGGRGGLCPVEELNVYDVLGADRIGFTPAPHHALTPRARRGPGPGG